MVKRIDPIFAALSWWPLIWHALIVPLVMLVPSPWHMWAVVAWVGLLPPLLCRLVHGLWPVEGRHVVSSAAARRWWWLQQLQMPFNRLPLFEETMRLVPGLYQAWLRLWGARVSLLCVFAPHVVVTDRQLLEVGRGAVIGDGCHFSPHAVLREGEWSILIASIRVGNGSLVGARAVLGPGVIIADDQQVTATQGMPPFSRWENGRRQLSGI